MRNLSAPVFVMAGLISAAAACECAYCVLLPPDESQRIASFHDRIGGICLELARIEQRLAADDLAALQAEMLSLTRQWLSISAVYFVQAPRTDADPAQWSDAISRVNRRLGEAFRAVQAGKTGEITVSIREIEALLGKLEEAIGVPTNYLRIVRLRANCAAFAEDDKSAAARFAVLDRQLQSVTKAWEPADKNYPPGVRKILAAVPAQIDRIRAKAKSGDVDSLRQEIEQLNQQLKALDGQVGQSAVKE